MLTNSNFNILDLVKLQLIENTISQRLGEINSIKDSQDLNSKEKKLKEICDELDMLNKKYNEKEIRRKKMEDKVGLQSEKIKKNEQKLFSGTITSSKELVSLQEEIKTLKESNDKIENQMLELMIEIDELLEEISDTREKKEKLEILVDSLKSQINKQIKSLEEKVEGLSAKKDAVISNIPKDYLKKYEQLKNKKGSAVGIFKDKICNGCNMQIPAYEAEKISDINKIYKCPLCGRMLVIYRDEIDNIRAELES